MCPFAGCTALSLFSWFVCLPVVFPNIHNSGNTLFIFSFLFDSFFFFWRWWRWSNQRGEKKHRPEVDKPVTAKGPLRHVRNGVLFRLTNPVEMLKRVKTNVDEQHPRLYRMYRRALLGLASNVGKEKGRKWDVSCMTTDTTVLFIYGG